MFSGFDDGFALAHFTVGVVCLCACGWVRVKRSDTVGRGHKEKITSGFRFAIHLLIHVP